MVERKWHLKALNHQLSKTRAKSQEDPMPSTHKAKEMKRRVSQRKATHKDQPACANAQIRNANGSGDNQSRERGNLRPKVGSKGAQASQVNSESKQAEEGIACMGKVA